MLNKFEVLKKASLVVLIPKSATKEQKENLLNKASSRRLRNINAVKSIHGKKH